MSARYAGLWVRPDRESWDGEWIRGGQRQRVSLRAAGGRQYELTGGEWLAGGRGIETRIIDQLRQVVRDPNPELVGQSAGAYRFSFEPSLRFLDPPGLKNFTGQAVVDSRLGVPLSVSCADASGTAACKFVFFRFDRPGRVRLPFVAADTVELQPARPIPVLLRGDVLRTIRDRLEAMGWESRTAWRGRVLLVQLDENRPRHVVELVGSRGRVEVWLCRDAAGGDASAQGAAVPVGGDASRRVVLERLAGANRGLDIELRTPLPVAANLRVRPRGRDNLEPGRLAALVVDGAAFSLATVDDAGVAEFADVGGLETARALAALASTRPLPSGFVARRSSGGR